jgi:hypothetical protein
MVFNHPHTCLDDIKQLVQKIRDLAAEKRSA